MLFSKAILRTISFFSLGGFISKVTSIAASVSSFIVRGFYNIASFFDKTIKPSYFSPDDERNYDEWISAHKDLIIKISGSKEALPLYMLPGSNNGEVLYVQPEIEDLNDYSECILRNDIRGILIEINKYLEAENKSLSFVAAKIGADYTKLDPQKMVLLFIQEYLLNDAINYKGSVNDVNKIEYLKEYLTKLLQKTSVIIHPEYHDLLDKIRLKLIIVKNTLELRRKPFKISDQIDGLVIKTKNIISDLQVFFYNIFNFQSNTTESLDCDFNESSKEQSSYITINKVTNWVVSVKNILNIVIIDNNKGINASGNSHNLTLDDINDFKGVTSSGVHPAFLEILNNNGSHTNTTNLWCSLVELQEATIYIIDIYKDLMIVNSKFNQGIGNRTGCEGRVLIKLDKKIKDGFDILKVKLNEIVKYKDILENYSLNINISAANRKKTVLLYGVLSNLNKHTDEFIDSYASFDLITINNILDSCVSSDYADHELIKTPSNLFLYSKIVSFLGGFRIKGVFNNSLLEIIKCYFIVKTEDNNTESIVGLKEDINVESDPGLMYYSIILAIFIDIIKSDLQEGLKSQIITTFKRYLTEEVNYNKIIIDHVLEELVKQVEYSNKTQKQNESLKIIIENHLELFRNNILDFIGSDLPGVTIIDKLESYVIDIITKVKSGETLAINLSHMIVDQLSKLDHNSITEHSTKSREILALTSNYIKQSSDYGATIIKLLSLISSFVNGYYSLNNNFLSVINESDPSINQKQVNDAEELKKLNNIKTRIGVAQKDNKLTLIKLNDACESIKSSILASDLILLSSIKQTTKSYYKIVNTDNGFKTKVMCAYSLINNLNFIYEVALVNYLLKVVFSIGILDDNKINRLSIILTALICNKKGISSSLYYFLTSLLSIVPSLNHNAAANWFEMKELCTTPLYKLSDLSGDDSLKLEKYEYHITKRFDDFFNLRLSICTVA